jgi:uncharacterized membrane protein
MSWHYLAGGSMAGCGSGSTCEKVLGSRWSEIAGILPVSGLAMGVYLAILVAGFFTGPAEELPVRRMAWSAMLILAGTVAGSAIWFTIVQKWIIGAFCPYCLTTHITGLLLSVLIIWQAARVTDHISRKGDRSAPVVRLFRPVQVTGLVMAGMIMAGLLAVTQVISAPRAVNSKSSSQDYMPDPDYHTVPMAGSPDAPYVVTLLFDYQCSHCQQLHFMLDEVIRLYGGKLAFLLRPAPLDPVCNPYIPRETDEFRNSCQLAQIGLAVWRADREVFPEFEDWMFSFETGDRWQPRSPEAARAKAEELAGHDKLDAALSDLWIGQYLQSCVSVYGRTISEGRGGIPKLIYGSRWIIPESFSAGDLAMILQKRLGVPGP